MNEEQYNWLNYRLHVKYQRNEKFTEDERSFFCDCLSDEDIEKIKFCQDELYMRLFNKYHHSLSSDYPKQQKFVISFRELLCFQSLVSDWKQVVKKTNHTRQLLQYVSKETREEIKRLKKSFSFLLIEYTTYEHVKREFNVYMYSRFLYILARRITLKYPSGYKISFLGEEIIFNEFSFSHIFFRHYGQVMKQYETGKSYFDDFFFEYDVLPEKIENILHRIEASGYVTIDNLESICFKFRNKVYSLYIQQETIQQKGKGNIQIWRVNTLYPVFGESLRALTSIKQEQLIDKELSVLI